MAHAALKLQGQFKFDVYHKDGQLIRSSDYVDNFITNTGVMYPYHFAFADCFRFLSVGNGIASNTIENPPTTGLDSPISNFLYVGGRPTWDSTKDSSYYTRPGEFDAGCGYVNNENGVSLLRQWILPDNTGFFTTPITFNEFMVSPGRPYVTGLGGVKFCSCDEYDDYATGKDCSSTSEYYRWVTGRYRTVNQIKRLGMCEATPAFARVLNTFSMNTGEILVVTYRLNVIVNTGLGFSYLPYSRPDGNPNWNESIRLYHSITNPGVMLINDGTYPYPKAPNDNLRLQHFDYSFGNSYHPYTFDYEYGESFVPPWGAPLEPSNFFLTNDSQNQNVEVYLSEDNLQFLVSPTGGNFSDTGHYAPWNIWQEGYMDIVFSEGDILSSGSSSYRYIYPNPSSGHFLTDITYWEDLGYLKEIQVSSSGVMPFRNHNNESIEDSLYWSKHPNYFNIRKNQGFGPDVNDVTSTTAMNSRIYKANKSSVTNLLLYVSTSARSGAVGYSHEFTNYQGGTSLKCRSFVAGYKDIAYGVSAFGGDKDNLIPFFDSVLSGISNASPPVFIPGIQTGETIVNSSTGAIITGHGNADYNDLFAQQYPIFNTRISWSVPCPYGVVGC
jgi:hypothetical protein